MHDDRRLGKPQTYADLGWPVLPIWPLAADGSCACGKPCSSVAKHPVGWLAPNGLDDATTDPATIERWFRRYPSANVAIRTGPESGLLVLDVDGPEGEASLAELERRHGPLPDLFPMQRTGRGVGWQAFLAYPNGRTIGNSSGRLGRALDSRGARGYALVPPSRTVHAYRWAADREPWMLPPEPAPAWLLDLLDPPEPPRAEWNGRAHRDGSRYALRALEAELALTAAAPKGRRNNQLNRSAHSLFRLARDGRLPPDVIAAGLTAAAAHAGLHGPEVARTIRSAAGARGVSL